MKPLAFTSFEFFQKEFSNFPYSVKCDVEYILDSAGEGGLIVSGLTHSDGDGERSRFVVICPRPNRPAECPSESERCPNPDECVR